MKQVKPLPAPLDGQRKKRGGRRWGPGTSRAGTEWEGKRLAPSQLTPCPVPRYRKMKERLGLTEIRKQANRMSFGEVRAHPALPPPPAAFLPLHLWPCPPAPDPGQHLSLRPGPPHPGLQSLPAPSTRHQSPRPEASHPPRIWRLFSLVPPLFPPPPRCTRASPGSTPARLLLPKPHPTDPARTSSDAVSSVKPISVLTPHARTRTRTAPLSCELREQ